MADLFFGHQGNKLPSSPKSEEIVRIDVHAMVTPRRRFGTWETTRDALEAPKVFPPSLQEFLLDLAADVEQLWQHLLSNGRMTAGELRKGAVTNPEPSSNTWVADELMSLRAELRSSYSELNWSISEVERHVRSGREALDALESQQQELQEEVRQHSGSHEHELDFGAPVCKTLNTQDILALHVQLKTELHPCRMDIRRLTAEHMEIMVEESDPPCQPPCLAASKTRPLQLADRNYKFRACELQGYTFTNGEAGLGQEDDINIVGDAGRRLKC